MKTAIEKRLEELRKEEKKLLEELAKHRARKRIPCACGKSHAIKDCTVIQTHWYVSPHGCIGGDYWVEGEQQFICPRDEKIVNRLLFKPDPKVPWEKRNDCRHSAEMQFKLMYSSLFGKLISTYREEYSGRLYNNYYVDQNQEKFGLKVQYLDEWNH